MTVILRKDNPFLPFWSFSTKKTSLKSHSTQYWIDANRPSSYLFVHCKNVKWAASSEFGTYRLCEQRRFRWACASAQSRQTLRCSLIQAVSQEEPSDRKPDPWPLWMAGHAQLKFVMTECSKAQIRLTGHRARSCENVSYAICEQQRRRSACASAQSDQRLCCSLLG